MLNEWSDRRPPPRRKVRLPGGELWIGLLSLIVLLCLAAGVVEALAGWRLILCG